MTDIETPLLEYKILSYRNVEKHVRVIFRGIMILQLPKLKYFIPENGWVYIFLMKIGDNNYL